MASSTTTVRARARRLGARAERLGPQAALAGASLANNALALGFTIVATRVLGTDGYGALAALVSTFLVLLVSGQSVQAAAARETALGRLGSPAEALAHWTRTLMLATGAAAVAGIVLQRPLAALIGVDEHPWAAAAVLPAGVLWTLVCLQRGVLQGLHRFGPVGTSIVGEAAGRLLVGAALGLAGAGVTGVFLATPLSFVLIALGLARAVATPFDARARADTPLQAGPGAGAGAGGTMIGGARPDEVVPEPGILPGPVLPAHPPLDPAHRTLRALVRGGWGAIGALALLSVLQNVDVILARHELGDDSAGAYAVAAVAAKVVVWVAVGVGLALLPQAAARAAAGEDPRPVLGRALALLAVVAAPALVLFAVAGRTVLTTAFGPDTADGADALLQLTAAMTLLAAAFLTAQYLIALGRMSLLGVLAVAVVAEVTLLLTAADPNPADYAWRVLAVQAAVASALGILALRPPAIGPARQPPPPPSSDGADGGAMRKSASTAAWRS